MGGERPDRRQHLATVGMGSNVGNREATISAAVQTLADKEGNRIRAVSCLYETEPFGKTDQDWFLNCVIQVETVQDLKAFFHTLQDVETLFHRKRREQWGPRTLDLDLLFFDDRISWEPELTLPHPGIPGRRFVLEPLCEIAPDLVHPSLKITIRDLLKKVPDPSRVICRERLPEEQRP